jgi:hypothetical protein
VKDEPRILLALLLQLRRDGYYLTDDMINGLIKQIVNAKKEQPAS